MNGSQFTTAQAFYTAHSPDAFVKVPVKGDDKRTEETCVPLTGKAIAAEVSWQGQGAVIPSNPEKNTTVESYVCKVTVWAWNLRITE